ncbi:HTH domain-containing protein [Candidatus Woesearchaeota archaeon]|nr:HTH domain-containing protein [Candidatus Woesearchaeota archaeon]
MEKIKIKKINVVIEGLNSFFNKSKGEFKQLQEGRLKNSVEVLSLSEDEYRNLFSRKRIDIIKALRHRKFISIYELAKQLKRSYKNVYDDVNLLLELGIIEKAEDMATHRDNYYVEFDKISVEIPVT